MNKFKYGDKVHIKPLNLDGKVIGSGKRIVNGIDCGVEYFVNVLIDDGSYIACNENDLELITYNECSCDCCDCCGREVCEDSDCDESNWDDDEDFENNKEAENLDNDKKFNLGDLYDPDEDEKEMIEEIAYDRYIQYESRKLAWEKYKVPMGWKE